MKKFIIIITIALYSLACTSTQPKQTIIDGTALGTTYHLVICDDTTEGTLALINQKFDQVTQSMSLYNDSSRLSLINANKSTELDSMLITCINQALKISEQTDGIYDVTIKPLTEAWGFAKSNKTANPNVDSLLQFIGYKKIKIEGNKIIKENPNIQIDLNSIAKGSTVDIIAKALEDLGHQNYLVEIGGEIYAKGLNAFGQQWRIGIDKPIEGNISPGTQLQEILNISNIAMATSGNYRRYYTDENGQKIVHTINPKTGFSTTSNLLSATVLAKNCALADGYATALMAMGLDEAKAFGEAHPEIYMYLIYSNSHGEMQTYRCANLENWLK